jgi:hypothetical protein
MSVYTMLGYMSVYIMSVYIMSLYIMSLYIISVYIMSVYIKSLYIISLYIMSVYMSIAILSLEHVTFLTAASCSGLTLSAGKILKKYSSSVTLFCTIWRPREVHISFQFDKITLQYSAVTSLQLRKSQVSCLEYGAGTKWLAYFTPAGRAVSVLEVRGLRLRLARPCSDYSNLDASHAVSTENQSLPFRQSVVSGES